MIQHFLLFAQRFFYQTNKLRLFVILQSSLKYEIKVMMYQYFYLSFHIHTMIEAIQKKKIRIFNCTFINKSLFDFKFFCDMYRYFNDFSF